MKNVKQPKRRRSGIDSRAVRRTLPPPRTAPPLSARAPDVPGTPHGQTGYAAAPVRVAVRRQRFKANTRALLYCRLLEPNPLRLADVTPVAAGTPGDDGEGHDARAPDTTYVRPYRMMSPCGDRRGAPRAHTDCKVLTRAHKAERTR